jgi:hypothetical protein
MTRVRRLVLPAGLLVALTLACAKNPESVDPKSLRVASRSGAQLWADNCSRCHATRAVDSYSDAQWDLVSHHMRLQANLTGAEQRAIADFLKSAN